MRWLAVIVASALPLNASGDKLADLYPYGADPLAEREGAHQAPRLFWEKPQRLDHSRNAQVDLEAGESATFALEAQGHLRLQRDDGQALPLLWLSRDGELWWQASWTPDSESKEWFHVTDKPSSLLARLEAETDFRGQLFVAALDPVPSPDSYQMANLSDSLEQVALADKNGERRDVQRLAQDALLELNVEGPMVVSVASRPAEEAAHQQQYALSWRLDETSWQQVNIERTQLSTLYQEVGATQLHGGMDRRYLTIPEGKHRLTLKASIPVFARIEQAKESYFLDFNEPEPTTSELTQELAEEPLTANGRTLEEMDALRQSNHLEGAADIALGYLEKTYRESNEGPFPGAQPQAARQALAGDIERSQRFFRNLFPEVGNAPLTMKTAWFATTRRLDLEADEQYYLGDGVLERLGHGVFVELADEPLSYPLPKRFGPSRLRLSIARLTAQQKADIWVQYDDNPPQRLNLSDPAQPVLSTPEDAVLSQVRSLPIVHPTLGGPFATERAPGHYWPVASVELPLPVGVDEVRIWSDERLPVALQYRASQAYEAGESAYRALLEQASTVSVEHLHLALEAVLNPDAKPLPLAPTPAQELENQWYPMLRYLHAAQAAYLDDVSPQAFEKVPGNVNERVRRARAEARSADWIGVLEALGKTGYGQHPDAYRLSQQALEAQGEHYLARRQRLATAVFGQSGEAKRLATEDMLTEYADTQRFDSQVRLLAARFLREGDEVLLDPLGEALHRAGDSLWATQLGLLLAHEGAAPTWLPEAAEAVGWLDTAEKAEKSREARALRLGDRAARDGDNAKAMTQWREAGEAGLARMERMKEAASIASALESPNRERRLAGIARWLDWSMSPQQTFDWVSLDNRLDSSGGFRTLFSEITQTPFALPHASAGTPVELEVVGPAVLRVQLRRVAPEPREPGEIDWLTADLIDSNGKATTLKAPMLSQGENAYLDTINGNTGIATGESHLIEVPAGLHRVRLQPNQHDYLTQVWQWQSTKHWAVLPPVTPLALKNLLQAPSGRDDDLPVTVPDYFQLREGEREPLSVRPSTELYSRKLTSTNTASIQHALESLAFPDHGDISDTSRGPGSWPEGSHAVQLEEVATDAGVPESPQKAYALAVALLWQLEQNPGRVDQVSARLAQLADRHAKVPAIGTLADRLLQMYEWERISSSFESAGVRQLPLETQMHSPFMRVRQALLPGLTADTLLLSGRGSEGVDLFTPEPLTIEVRLTQRVLPYEARDPAEVMIQLDDREPRRVRLSEGQTVERIRLESGQHALRLWLGSPSQQQYVTARLNRAESGEPLLEEEKRTYHIAAPGQPARFYVKGPAWVRVDEWPTRNGATQYRFVAPGWQSLSFEAGDSEDRYYRLHALRRSPEAGMPLEPGVMKASLAVPAKGPTPPLRGEDPIAWEYDDHYAPGAGLNSWGGYLGFVERIDGSEDDVEPVQGTKAFEAGVSYRVRHPDRRLFSRSDLFMRQLESSHEIVGTKQWVDFYPEDSDWQFGFFGEAYLQPESVEGIDGDHHWAIRLQGSVERTYRLSPRLRHEPGVTLNQRWLSLNSVPLSALSDIDPDIFSPYKDDHQRSLVLSDRLTWSPYLDQRLYLDGALVSNASLNPFDPDYAEVTAAGRQLFGSVAGEAGLRWRRYFDDDDREASINHKRIFVGGNLLSFDSGANALTLRAETEYDLDRSDVGFRLRIGYEANEGRLSPARRPDELDFLPLRRAQQRERVDTNRLDPVYP